jgi:hypothetical protein
VVNEIFLFLFFRFKRNYLNIPRYAEVHLWNSKKKIGIGWRINWSKNTINLIIYRVWKKKENISKERNNQMRIKNKPRVLTFNLIIIQTVRCVLLYWTFWAMVLFGLWIARWRRHDGDGSRRGSIFLFLISCQGFLI